MSLVLIHTQIIKGARPHKQCEFCYNILDKSLISEGFQGGLIGRQSGPAGPVGPGGPSSGQGGPGGQGDPVGQGGQVFGFHGLNHQIFEKS